MVNFIPDQLFITKTSVVYPPFKNGLYLEEYFLNYMATKNKTTDKNGRLFIPALWTNFQIEQWFPQRRDYMQNVLNKWISENPSTNGYFVVVQHDDGPMLRLPTNTTIYGACNGQIPLPLIYEDLQHKLENNLKNPISFKNKTTLCSFVGSVTHNVRKSIIDMYQRNHRFKFSLRQGWTNQVQVDHQQLFIDYTLNSKFALAPRGYGKSSFRFFEILKLGCIPVYVWDDKEWLPYKDVLDYDKFCVSIHVSELEILEDILMSISEKSYNKMLAEYEKIKHMFEMPYMCEYICGNGQEEKSNKNALPVPLPADTLPVPLPIQESTLGTGMFRIPIIEEDNDEDKKLDESDTINITFETEPIIERKYCPKVLLVAIAIGQQYLQKYNQIFRRSHEAYAKKHGYDFKVIDQFIDPTYQSSPMSLFYQKMLVSDTNYDFVIFIDSDILINITAPAIHLSVNFGDNIGIVDEYSQPTPDLRLKIQKMMGWETSAVDYYKLCGLDLDTKIVLNSGVLVIQPKKHMKLLEFVYKTYLPRSISHHRGPHYEQTSLGYELQTKSRFVLLNNRWNAIWALHKTAGANLGEFFRNNYFIHFAGNTDINMAPNLEQLNRYT
jgi:Exostosin family